MQEIKYNKLNEIPPNSESDIINIEENHSRCLIFIYRQKNSYMEIFYKNGIIIWLLF